MVRIRYGMVILGGFVAGIGGAVFTIGSGIPMGVGITGGEGFIALAIMIFGRWRPWRAFAATMLFGFTIAIGSQMQVYLNQLVIPTELISALPYIVTIAAVAGLVGKRAAPRGRRHPLLPRVAAPPSACPGLGDGRRRRPHGGVGRRGRRVTTRGDGRGRSR